MKKKIPTPQNDIIGIILANQWDENGNVIGVSIYTDREEIYIVAQNKRIKELANLIQVKVRVGGKIKKGLDGNNLIYVKTFKTMENEQWTEKLIIGGDMRIIAVKGFKVVEEWWRRKK